MFITSYEYIEIQNQLNKLQSELVKLIVDAENKKHEEIIKSEKDKAIEEFNIWIRKMPITQCVNVPESLNVWLASRGID